MEDKALASSAQGFDQMRQILLPFPKVEIGSELYLKYVTKKTETELPKYYYGIFSFAENGCWQASHRTITSHLPLYIEVNDPDHVLEVVQTHKDDIHTLDLKLKQPICRSTTPGSEIGVINERKYTWVAVSSIKNSAASDRVLKSQFQLLTFFLSLIHFRKLIFYIRSNLFFRGISYILQSTSIWLYEYLVSILRYPNEMIHYTKDMMRISLEPREIFRYAVKEKRRKNSNRFYGINWNTDYKSHIDTSAFMP